MYKWIRKRKWWMAIYICSFGLLLTNEYVLYLNICCHVSLKRTKLTNYNFRYQIKLALLKPNQHSNKMKLNHIKKILDSPHIATNSTERMGTARRIIHMYDNTN